MPFYNFTKIALKQNEFKNFIYQQLLNSILCVYK